MANCRVHGHDLPTMIVEVAEVRNRTDSFEVYVDDAIFSVVILMGQ